MPCEGMLKAKQTVAERMQEVREATLRIDGLLANRTVQVRVGPQGAVTFVGLTDAQRDRMTDGCIYRRIMASGSASARAAITRAEQMAGRTVDKRVISQGVHSHDGGQTWVKD